MEAARVANYASVYLLDHTSNPVAAVAAAARLCYSDLGIAELYESTTPDKAADMVRKILALGHGSVLEHANFTFGIEGISRACSHQLVRHRISSPSQQSQRYVRSEEPRVITPQSVIDAGQQERFNAAMEAAWAYYRALLNAGVPKEDARFVLPNAAETKLVVTMNARSLHHFFSLRCCNRAQWEIRQLAEAMLMLCKDSAAPLFEDCGPECVRGACSEGAMTCGRVQEMRALYGWPRR